MSVSWRPVRQIRRTAKSPTLTVARWRAESMTKITGPGAAVASGLDPALAAASAETSPIGVARDCADAGWPDIAYAAKQRAPGKRARLFITHLHKMKETEAHGRGSRPRRLAPRRIICK